MSHADVIDLARRAFMLALSLAAPTLLAALAVGLFVSVVQAVTQIQDQTLSFIAKLFAVAAVFLITLSWTLQTAVRYTAEIFRSLPALVS